MTLEWIDALSNPQSIMAVYGMSAPELEGVRIEEISLSANGPMFRLRFDLPKFPASPPEKWRRGGLDVVQLEVGFGGLQAISISKFSVESVCDLKIRKNDLIEFSSVSEFVSLQGVAASATVLRVSAYASGSA